MPPAFVPQLLLQPCGAARVVSLYPDPADAAAASLNLAKTHEPETYNLGKYSDGDRITVSSQAICRCLWFVVPFLTGCL